MGKAHKHSASKGGKSKQQSIIEHALPLLNLDVHGQLSHEAGRKRFNACFELCDSCGLHAHGTWSYVGPPRNGSCDDVWPRNSGVESRRPIFAK